MKSQNDYEMIKYVLDGQKGTMYLQICLSVCTNHK